MTVQTEIDKSGPYAGAGTTGPFTVGFRFLDDSHLRVVKTSGGIETDLVLPTDYTVTGAGASSGAVTLVVALAVGETLTIVRNPPFTQQADYVDNDAFPAESHENALDLLTMQTQYLKERQGRSLTLPVSVEGAITELPVPQSNHVIGWNADANGLENYDPSLFATVVAFGTANCDLFSGDGVETVFTLSANPGALNNLDISIGGVDQSPGINYTWVSGTTLTFTSPPPAGTDNIKVRYMQGLPQGYTNSDLVSHSAEGTGAVPRTVQEVLRTDIPLNPLSYGGDPTGIADSRAAIQEAIDVLAAAGGGIVDCSKGRWLIDSDDLLIKKGVTVLGSYLAVGEKRDSWNYSTDKSCFIVNPAYTIRLNDEWAALKGMLLLRKGLTYPTSIVEATAEVAAFAGTAVTIGDGVDPTDSASDVYVGYCMALGFETMLESVYNERPRIEYLFGDCTNGISLTQVYDMNHVNKCHFWPFLTAHRAWTFAGDAGWRRQGKAFSFVNGVDWGQANECFSYGYDTGFYVEDCSNVELLNCGSDGWKDNNTYSIGFDILGNSQNVNLIGCKSAAKNTLVHVNLDGANAQCVKITGGNLWAASTTTGAGVHVEGGDCVISGGVSFFDMPTGVRTSSGTGKVIVDCAVLQSVATPWNLYRTDTVSISNIVFNSSTDSTVGERGLFDGGLSDRYVSAYNASAGGYRIVGQKARGTAAAPTQAQSSDTPIRFQGRALDDTGAWRSTASLDATCRAATTSTSSPGSWILSTTGVGSVSPTQRWILNENGHLFPITDNAYSLGATGFRTSSVWSANGTIQTSDERLKTDFKPCDLGLNFITKLDVQSWRWISGGTEVVRQVYRDENGNECAPEYEGATPAEIITKDKPGVRRFYSPTAQNVKAALDAVGCEDFAGWVLADKDDPDSTQNLRMDQLIGPLIQSVQELTARVQELEANKK